MDSRRILITGLSSYWGGRLAQVLEREPGVQAIVGVDSSDPKHELERTEFVRVDTQHGLIRRIVHAAAIDTVIDTRLVVDPLTEPLKRAHEINVIGTMNILGACSGSESPVRKFVFKSSAHYYGCEQDDPAFFTEDMVRPHPPRTAIERDIVEAEEAVADFAARNRDTTVTVLRVANGIGGEAAHLAPVAAVAAGRPLDPRVRPALSVHPRGRHRRGARARRPPRPARDLQRRRRRSARALGGRVAARQALAAGAAAVGHRVRGRPAAPARACGFRSSCCASCGSDAGWTTVG